MTSVIPRSSHASIVTGSSTLDQFNQDNRNRYSTSIGTSYGHSRAHSRAVSQSNPFEVIYSSHDLTFESTGQPYLTVSRQPPAPAPSIPNLGQHSPWHSRSNYDLITENIVTSKKPISEILNNSSSSSNSRAINNNNNNNNNNNHPVVTVVGSPALNRSGSTISRLATLRNRNKIKQRNKTIKRKDLLKEKLESKPSTDGKQKHRTEKTSWFSWPKFSFPVLRKRSLKYRSVHNGQTPNFTTRHEFMNFIQMSNYNQIVGSSLPQRMKMWNYTQPLHPHPLLHWHIEDFREKEPAVKPTITHSRKASVSVLDILYQNYKARAFEVAQRRHYKNLSGVDYMKVPPPFQKLYPEDAALLSRREVHQINTKLLVEILLRRTVAAKMEHRLKQNGAGIDKVEQSSTLSFSSLSSASPPSSSSSGNSTGKRHTKGGAHSKRRSNSPGSGTHHNDNLVLQNEAIFKEAISKSIDHSPKDVKERAIFKSEPKPIMSSNKLVNQFTLDPKTNILAKFMNGGTQNRTGGEHIYHLVPQQNKSRSTLSSDDKTFDSSSSGDYNNNTLPRERRSYSFGDSFSTQSRDKVRKSESTTNTSILHYLDHLSLEVGSVLEELEPDRNGSGSTTVRLKDSLPKVPSTMKLGSRHIVPKNIVEPASIIEKLNEYDLLAK